MHLIPSMVLAIGIVLAWRWEWVGALIFIGWAAWYPPWARGFHRSIYAIIAGIPALVGLLYLAGWIWRKQVRSAP